MPNLTLTAIATWPDMLTSRKVNKEEKTSMKRLYRSRTDRKIWGVCGGLAKYFEIDPTIVRIIAIASIFASGIGLLTYVVAAAVMPLEPRMNSEAT